MSLNDLNSPLIFVSYGSVDNKHPPGSTKGFVDALLTALEFQISQFGWPEVTFWYAPDELRVGDIWPEELGKMVQEADLFLAILSPNYVVSKWCKQELSIMLRRVATAEKRLREKRILPVEKLGVSLPSDLSEYLDQVQWVRFYEKQKNIDRLFWHIRPRPQKKWQDAVERLSDAIVTRLNELASAAAEAAAPRDRTAAAESPKGAEITSAKTPATLSEVRHRAWNYNTKESSGRTIFVAKPAMDLEDEYYALVEDLRHEGYQVVPDVDAELTQNGPQLLSAVTGALNEAEASVHLLGEDTGPRPEGLDKDLLPLQLQLAADAARRRKGFRRMIWAPKVMPLGSTLGNSSEVRDPFDVLAYFCRELPTEQSFVETDQIIGNTASYFIESVLHILDSVGRI